MKINIAFDGKTRNSKLYVIPGKKSCLFGMDFMILFDLCKLLMNTFCNEIDISEKAKAFGTENISKDVKKKFPTVCSKGLGLCSNTETKVLQKEKVPPIKIYIGAWCRAVQLPLTDLLRTVCWIKVRPNPARSFAKNKQPAKPANGTGGLRANGLVRSVSGLYTAIKTISIK